MLESGIRGLSFMWKAVERAVLSPVPCSFSQCVDFFCCA